MRCSTVRRSWRLCTNSPARTFRASATRNARQRVDELLENGIDVFTTLNDANIESLGKLVFQIIGVARGHPCACSAPDAGLGKGPVFPKEGWSPRSPRPGQQQATPSGGRATRRGPSTALMSWTGRCSRSGPLDKLGVVEVGTELSEERVGDLFRGAAHTCRVFEDNRSPVPETVGGASPDCQGVSGFVRKAGGMAMR